MPLGVGDGGIIVKAHSIRVEVLSAHYSAYASAHAKAGACEAMLLCMILM